MKETTTARLEEVGDKLAQLVEVDVPDLLEERGGLLTVEERDALWAFIRLLNLQARKVAEQIVDAVMKATA